LFNAALRGETCWRRHEFRSDRIADAIGEDTVDLHQCIAVQLPAHDVGERIELIGMLGAPQRDTKRLLIEHPPHRQIKDTLAVLLTRERITALGARLEFHSLPELSAQMQSAEQNFLNLSKLPHAKQPRQNAVCGEPDGT
jgi:hypothetical protein